MSKQQRASGKHRASSSAAGRRAAGSRPVRKPRIARPQPRLNTAEIQGLYSPFGQGQTAALGGGAAAGAAGGAGAGELAGAAGGGDFLALFNRMGGLDGILSTMGKVQKMVTIFKQFGPIFKLFGGGFGLGGLGLGGQVKTASLRRPKARQAAAGRSSAASSHRLRVKPKGSLR
ncbi:hypothetical protein WMW72_07630 [Paenibacillus filicis]|uniref:Uncharacterized protein n=1 Tax=Paenibacillus filicis TaxID=669464 RepID=A0ABU9DFZ1_9BACL